MIEKVVPAKSSWSGIVKKGQRLKITDLQGQQAVDFLCYNNNDRSDRYSATNTGDLSCAGYLEYIVLQHSVKLPKYFFHLQLAVI